MIFNQDILLIQQLIDLQNCGNFNSCVEAKYDPLNGHVPRGFSGATGSLTDVLLVIVFAEPGFPPLDEQYTGDANLDVKKILEATFFRSELNIFHQNVIRFLNDVFPMLKGDIDELLKKVWLTESRFCSLADPLGTISAKDRLICSKKHLAKQISLFPNAITLLAGGKAKQARPVISNAIECGAFAPPGCNHKKVRESHSKAAKIIRAHITKFLTESR